MDHPTDEPTPTSVTGDSPREAIWRRHFRQVSVPGDIWVPQKGHLSGPVGLAFLGWAGGVIFIQRPHCGHMQKGLPGSLSETKNLLQCGQMTGLPMTKSPTLIQVQTRPRVKRLLAQAFKTEAPQGRHPGKGHQMPPPQRF